MDFMQVEYCQLLQMPMHAQTILQLNRQATQDAKPIVAQTPLGG